MSYLFEVETVRSPALRVAETLSATFDIDLGTAGFTALASNYYSVDPSRLARFVRTMLDGSVLRHSEYRGFARGSLGICLALPDGPPDLAEARDSVRMMSR